MVASFTALQLFSAYNFVKINLTVSYNILLYRDAEAAIYRESPNIITPLMYVMISVYADRLQAEEG